MVTTPRDHIQILKRTKTCQTCGVAYEAECSSTKTVGLLYEHFMSEKGMCPSCGDLDHKAWLVKVAAEDEIRRRAERVKSWQEKKCPPNYLETVVDLLPEVARVNARHVAMWKYGPKGLILSGPTGSGKSRLMYQLAERVYVDEMRKVSILTANDFSHQCSRNFFNGTGEDWVDGLTKVDVLFFDDVGKGRMTERNQCEFFHVVDTRMSYKRPIICTMNHTGETLAASLSDDIGVPLVRRLRECCEFIAFE